MAAFHTLPSCSSVIPKRSGTTGADTSELACDAIWRWWQRLGRQHYWYAPKLLVLCDCGGSNGYRLHRFKEELHTRIFHAGSSDYSEAKLFYV